MPPPLQLSTSFVFQIFQSLYFRLIHTPVSLRPSSVSHTLEQNLGFHGTFGGLGSRFLFEGGPTDTGSSLAIRVFDPGSAQ